MATIRKNIESPDALIMEREGPLLTYRFATGTVSVDLDLDDESMSDTTTSARFNDIDGDRWVTITGSVRKEGRNYRLNLRLDAERAEILHTLLGEALVNADVFAEITRQRA